MKQFNLFVDAELEKTAVITVNGETAKFEQSNGGAKVCKFTMDDDVAEVNVTRKHELLTPLWFIWGMFCFLISGFGIFDVSFGRKLPLNSKFITRLDGDFSALQLSAANKKDADAVKVIATGCTLENAENDSLNKVIKKRRRILIAVKFLCWLALIAAIVTLIIVK